MAFFSPGLSTDGGDNDIKINFASDRYMKGIAPGSNIVALGILVDYHNIDRIRLFLCIAGDCHLVTCS